MAFINFIRDYQRLARFRFGRFEGMKGPGVVFTLPIIHKVVRVDLRTEVLDIPKQTNITKDNASIDIDFLVYMRVDVNAAEKAVLEVEDYRVAVMGLATTTLRAVTGDIALDEVLSERDKINELIRSRLDSETERWGIKVTNVEIRELIPPREIQEAMNRQMSAERMRRAVVLEADGAKQANITVAEGEKQAVILRAEGERQAAILEAEGYAQALGTIFNVAKTVDTNTMSLQYFDTLKTVGASPASKFFFPLELTKLIERALQGTTTGNDSYCTPPLGGGGGGGEGGRGRAPCRGQAVPEPARPYPTVPSPRGGIEPRIEGTQSSLGEVLAAESQMLPETPGRREVFNSELERAGIVSEDSRRRAVGALCAARSSTCSRTTNRERRPKGIASSGVRRRRIAAQHPPRPLIRSSA